MMPVQKGKEVILLKKLIRKYGHVWMLSYAFIYIPWFTRLQENINKPYHVMHTALDDLIPFNEYDSFRRDLYRTLSDVVFICSSHHRIFLLSEP